LDGSGPARRVAGRFRAPAKVNLFLAAGPRRADGYHDLLTVFQTVPIWDRLEITVTHTAEGGGWRFGVGPAATGSRPPRIGGGEDFPRDLDNLAGQAAKLFVEGLPSGPLGGEGRSGGRSIRKSRNPASAEIAVTIEKGIPVAAGLGGGSSDAATVLLGLQALLNHPLAPGDLRALAGQLGSDVPFFLQGGRAVGRGRGEILTPLSPKPRLPLVLGLPCSSPGSGRPSLSLRTSDVYREFDRLALRLGAWGDWERREEDLAEVLAALAARDLAGVAARLRNDLEAPAVSLCPEIRPILDALRRAGCAAAGISGSGPSVFGLAPSWAAARLAARTAGDYLPAGHRDLVAFVPVLSGTGRR
jgi:4-diphosphocytidyl-2-C-methyl-D-erythritol kinase